MAEEIENIQQKLNWHWRNSMRPVRFFMFDSRAGLPLILLFFYARPSTIIFSILFMAFFHFLEQKGLTFPAAMRNFRAWIVGRERPGWPSALRKKFIDWG